ncbi:MAG TPA: PAS domain S-box protein, partial [Candidatus Methanoperedens sp.]
DLKGNFLSINKIGSQLLGGTVEEIIGSNINDWLAPQSYKIFEDRVRKIFLNQPLEQPVVIEVITKNGEHKWGEVTTRLIKDGDRIVGVHGISRDITDKIRLEKKLKESEEKYRELFNNANDCIYTIDLNGQFLTVNDSVVKAMKCDSVEEVLTSNMSKWMTQKSLEDAIKFIQEIITKEDYYNRSVVIEIIRKDGMHVWFEHKARPIKDNNNNIMGLHGIGRDITEKKRLEQELKESEAKYRDLFENAQDAMYILDNEINFLKMNTKGIEILGCTKEEVIGSNISRWVTSESLRIIQERQKKRLFREKVTPTDVLELVCKNGEHRWVEIRSRVIRSNDGRIEYHGIARDITENRLLKQELNKSSKQQKLLHYLLQSTRGGKTRALILKHLSDKSYNANQLATALNMDYKTIKHHLNVLIKNGIVGKSSDGYSDLYFISNNIDLNLKG